MAEGFSKVSPPLSGCCWETWWAIIEIKELRLRLFVAPCRTFSPLNGTQQGPVGVKSQLRGDAAVSDVTSPGCGTVQELRLAPASDKILTTVSSSQEELVRGVDRRQCITAACEEICERIYTESEQMQECWEEQGHLFLFSWHDSDKGSEWVTDRHPNHPAAQSRLQGPIAQSFPILCTGYFSCCYRLSLTLRLLIVLYVFFCCKIGLWRHK